MLKSGNISSQAFVKTIAYMLWGCHRTPAHQLTTTARNIVLVL